MKICLVGAELFHADKRTDGQTHTHDEANRHLSQLCERAKNGCKQFPFQCCD